MGARRVQSPHALLHRTPPKDCKVQTSAPVPPSSDVHVSGEGRDWCPRRASKSSSGDSAAAAACKENAGQCLSVRPSVRAPMRNRNNLSNPNAPHWLAGPPAPGRPTDLRYVQLYVILPHRRPAARRASSPTPSSAIAATQAATLDRQTARRPCGFDRTDSASEGRPG